MSYSENPAPLDAMHQPDSTQIPSNPSVPHDAAVHPSVPSIGQSNPSSQPSLESLKKKSALTLPLFGGAKTKAHRFSQGHVESGISPYSGQGTHEDPYLVEWLRDDPENPQNFSSGRKWAITAVVTLSTLAVTFASSAYSASAQEIIRELHTTSEAFDAGISLFVWGFAVGPAFWAPLSELYGRRYIFFVTQAIMTVFIAANAGAPNMASVLVFRFLAATFGAAPLTNAGGIIADLFAGFERGLPLSLFSAAPFIGPTLGPVVGGFVTITVGWRWVQGVCCIFAGVVGISLVALLPETYGPSLLRKRAAQLSKQTGKVYISTLDQGKGGGAKASQVFSKALLRPWVLLFREPIVLITSMYLSVLYATLYLFIAALPIVYSELRGWNAGVGSLPFLSILTGMFVGLAYTILDDKFRYQKLGKSATPESRLPPAMVGAVALPIGLFGFAWTNAPSVPWPASVILCGPFAFGMVPVFICLFNYLLDSYAIFAASVLAASAILRALIGGAFPLFTTAMFDNLGIHWAASIPGFLTVLCLPFPFVMYKHGASVRMKCKIAKEAAILMARMQARDNEAEERNEKAEEKSGEARA